MATSSSSSGDVDERSWVDIVGEDDNLSFSSADVEERSWVDIKAEVDLASSCHFSWVDNLVPPALTVISAVQKENLQRAPEREMTPEDRRRRYFYINWTCDPECKICYPSHDDPPLWDDEITVKDKRRRKQYQPSQAKTKFENPRKSRCRYSNCSRYKLHQLGQRENNLLEPKDLFAGKLPPHQGLPVSAAFKLAPNRRCLYQQQLKWINESGCWLILEFLYGRFPLKDAVVSKCVNRSHSSSRRAKTVNNLENEKEFRRMMAQKRWDVSATILKDELF